MSTIDPIVAAHYNPAGKDSGALHEYIMQFMLAETTFDTWLLTGDFTENEQDAQWLQIVDQRPNRCPAERWVHVQGFTEGHQKLLRDSILFFRQTPPHLL